MQLLPYLKSLHPSLVSRKRFLTESGKFMAAGTFTTMLGATPTETSAQQPQTPAPQDVEKPIVLEQWKSEYDQDTGPVPTPLPPDRRMGYAVVGLGHLSLEQILPALSGCKKSKLAALVSGNAEKMQKVAAQYGIKSSNCYSYQSFDQLKDNKEVDVIYIVLPNSMHKEFTIRGAQAGKHILCEKPMAVSQQECREMIDACKKANVKLMVAYRIQYQPHNRMLRDILQKGEFGNAKFVDASNCQSSANPAHWRHKKALAGGGALPDIGLYCLNTTRFILGEEPTEVFAYQYSTPADPLFTEVEELVSWQMKFASGIIANCSTHYHVHESRYYRVLCEKGWLHMDKAYAYKGQQLSTARAQGPQELHQQIGLIEKDQFALEMDHFSMCIMENKPPYTPGEEGLQDQMLMEAIYQSAKEGKPVKVQAPIKILRGPEPKLG